MRESATNYSRCKKREGKSRARLRLAILISTVLSIALLLSLTSCMFAPEEPVGRWGVINEQGEWVVEPQFFNTGGRFIDGRAPMSDEDWPGTLPGLSYPGHWGYIDREGNWIIEPAYSRIGLFHDGIARAEDPEEASGAWLAFGLIDVNGNWVIEPQFDRLEEFAENGLAAASTTNDMWGFIDRKGNWVIEPVYEYAYHFSPNGYAFILKGANNSCFLIDSEGNIVAEFQNGVYGTFSENHLIPASFSTDSLYGIVDLSGKWTVEPVFEDIRGFYENGTAFAQESTTHLWGLINETGEWLIEPQYSIASWFSDDLIRVVDPRTDLAGLVDMTGAWVLQPRFYWVDESYEDGVPFAAKDPEIDLWGFANMDGEWVIEPQYEEAFSFAEGRAVVKVPPAEAHS